MNRTITPSRVAALFVAILAVVLGQTAFGQARSFGANSFFLDDNLGHKMQITTPQPGDPGYAQWVLGGALSWRLPIPPVNGASMAFVQTGTSANQVLVWNPPTASGGTGGAEGTWTTGLVQPSNVQLSSGQFLMGNGSNLGSAVSLSGDIGSVSPTGVVTFNNSAGTRSDLGLGTIATQNANSVAITGGTLNGTAIGGSTPSTGSFTTTTASTSLATPLITSTGSTLNIAPTGNGGGTGFLTTISGGQSTNNGSNGGNLNINGGAPGTGGNFGTVNINTGGGNVNIGNAAGSVTSFAGTVNFPPGSLSSSDINLAQNALMVGDASSHATGLASGGNNLILLTDGTGAPAWSNTLPAVSGANLTNLNANNITSGTLNVTRGGTGSTSFSGNQIVIANAAGTSLISGGAGTATQVLHGNAGGAPTYGAIVNGDITNGTIDLTTKVTGALPVLNGGTGSTTAGGARTNLGAAASGVNNDITSLTGLTSAIPVSEGGTGVTSITGNQIVVSNATGTGFIGGGAGTTTQVLHGNAGGAPTYGQIVNGDITNGTIDLTTKVTGALPATNGGTGQSSLTQHAVLVGNGTSGIATVAVGTANTVLHGNTGADPSFSAVDLANDVTGTLAVGKGGTGSTTAGGARTNLGLGTIATQDANNVTITGGSVAASTISGILPVAEGGTGTSTAPTSGQILIGNAGGTAYAPKTLSGDITVDNLGAVSLATTGVTANTYGSATQVPVFAVDGKGRVTSVTNTTITGVLPGGLAGGDLTGSYPNPTIANLAVTNAKIANGTIDLTTKVTGQLPVASGGTGVATANPNTFFAGPASGVVAAAPSFRALTAADFPAGGINASSVALTTNDLMVGDGSGHGSALATATNGVLVTDGSGVPSISTTLPAVSGANITNLNAGNISSGTLPISRGGTGQTTAAAALNALLPTQTGNNGKVLSTNGTTASWTAAASGTVTSVDVSGGTTGLSASGGPITTSGTITLGGTLAVANGGTGVSTASANTFFAGPTSGLAAAPSFRALTAADFPAGGINASSIALTTNDLMVGDGSGHGSALATATNGVLVTDGSGVPSISTTLPAVSGANITNLNANNISSGTLPISRGGTGGTTATTAFNNLSPLTTLGDVMYHDGTNNVRLAGNTTTTKKFLTQTGDGTNSAAPAWATISASDIPSGSGSYIQNQTAATQTADFKISGTGTAGILNATTGVRIAGAAAAGNYLRGDGANFVSSGLSMADASGTLSVSHGGTGATTANGALTNLLPSQTGNNGKLLTTDGTNTSWTSAATGTVTSVDVSGGTTGLTSSGGPITSSGTITLGGTLAVANGGTGATSAAAALNNLLPTQTGNNGKVLSTNGTTASWTTAGNGTVTSVDISGGTTGLTASGGPVTSSGTITLGGTLAVANGGTGVSTATGNTIFASPANGSSGAPLFRSLVAADFPNGGINASAISLAQNALLMGNASNQGSALASGGNNKILTTNGSGVPTWGNTLPTGTDGSNITNLNASNVTSGTLPIANGGTGGTTATTAFNNLSPLTTLGDLLTHNGTNNVRVAGNTTITKKFLTQTGDGTNSAAPAWNTIAASDIPNLDASKITTGTLSPARGGLGFDASGATDGQIPIGQTSDHTLALATITAGSNIAVTNGGHSISVATLNNPTFSTSVSTPTLTNAGAMTMNPATQGAANATGSAISITGGTGGTGGTGNAGGAINIAGGPPGAPSTTYGAVNIQTGNGNVNIGNSGGTTTFAGNVSFPSGSVSAGSIALAQNNMFVGNASNVASALAPSASSVLVTNGSSVPSWSSTLPAVSGANITNLNASNISSGTLGAANGGTGFTTYANGDMLVGNGSNTLSKLGAGSNGQVLTIVSGVPAWSSSSAMTNPMTTTGDMIYASTNSGTPARRAIGSTGQVLTVSGGLPTWATPSYTTSAPGSFTQLYLGSDAPQTPASRLDVNGDIAWRPTSVTITGSSTNNIDASGSSNVQLSTSFSSTAITAATESANVVTITSANSYAPGDLVTVAGVTPSGYNGTWTVSTATGTSFTYYNTTSGLGNGTVFGTATPASFSITGLSSASSASGKRLRLYNITSAPMTLRNNSGSSDVPILTLGGGDITLGSSSTDGSSVELVYSATKSAWVMSSSYQKTIAGIVAPGTQYAIEAADQTFSTSNVNDATLQFPVVAGHTYQIAGVLNIVSSGTSQNFQCAFTTGSSSSVIQVSLFCYANLTGSNNFQAAVLETADNTFSTLALGNNVTNGVNLQGIIKPAVSGTLQFVWKNGATSGQLKANSWMSLTRVD